MNMENQQMNKLIKILSLSAITLALSACGSSNSGSSEVIPTPPLVSTLPSVIIGEISAVSASTITVNQHELPATSADIEIDETNASLAQLKVGMMVEVETNGSQATEIDYDPNFKGPVFVQGDSVSIAGVQLESFDKSQVNNGDLVEVSGYSSAYNTLTVTYQQPISNLQTELEVEGVVTMLDSQQRTFMLGNISVNYQQADVDGVLANEQFVEVEGFLSGQQLMATEVDSERRSDFTDNIDTEFSGQITWLNNDATLMTINNNLQVSLTAQTRYEDGVAADLAVGAFVDVEATYQQSNDLFVAQEVEFESKGNGSFVNNSQFSVSGLTVYNQGIVSVNGIEFVINNQTIFDDGLTPATINGQWLELEGLIADDKNIVHEVELLDADDSLNLTGSISMTENSQAMLWGYISEDNSLAPFVGQYAELECDFVSGNQVRACHLDD